MEGRDLLTAGFLKRARVKKILAYRDKDDQIYKKNKHLI
jgi:hypothetical protein